MLIAIAVSVGISLLSAGLTWLMSDSDKEPPKTPWSGDPQRFRPVDGDPIPVIFGTVDIAPAVVWQGEKNTVNGDSGYSTSGVISTGVPLNYVPIHWVIASGPVDKISEVTITTDHEKALKLWGEDSPENPLILHGPGAASPEGVDVRWVPRTIAVDPDQIPMFDSVEARVLNGEQTTGLPNDAPGSPWGADIGFRHVTSMYGGVIAGASLLLGGDGPQRTGATPGSLRMRVTRIFARSAGRAEWYPAKATADEININPVHVIHDMLTDPIWGPTHLALSEIDDMSFKRAADIMFDEGVFMSARLSASEDAASFLTQVMSLCNAAPYQDPETGKYALAIATDDYVEGMLFVFGDHNSRGEMVRQYAKDRATRMTIKYTKSYQRASDRRTSLSPVPPDEERIFSQTNPAMYDKYGEVEATHDYMELRTSETASKIATRDLLMMSRPLAALSLTTTWNARFGTLYARKLYPGSTFIWGSEIAGIDPIVFRVTAIDFGAGSDSSVHIEAIEDAFAFPDALEPDPPESQWEDPSKEPEPATPRIPFQLPLWLWYQLDLETNPYAKLSDHKDAGARPYALAAGRPAPGTRDYALHVDGVTRAFSQAFTRFHKNQKPIAQSDTTVQLLDEGNGAPSLAFGAGFTPIIMVADELMEVLAWNPATRVATVCRGWLDTVPSFSSHAAGSDVAVLGAIYDGGSRFVRQFSTDNRLVSSGTVGIKALTRTSLGTLAPSDAPIDVLDMLPFDGISVKPRSLLPLPPANMQIAPGAFRNTQVTWSFRDRLGSPECDNAQSGGKLAGVTFTLEISPTEPGGTQRTITGITDESYTYTQAEKGADNTIDTVCLFRLWSVDENGRVSWQVYEKTSLV